jgi:F-type H+-transporting ATPase subunit b
VEFLKDLVKDPEFYVGVALLLFIGLLVWVKVPRIAAQKLDETAQKIRDQLAEAERLRQEAEHLLASIKKERQAAEGLAAQMIADATAQAERIRSEAQKTLQEQVVRRAQMAERKIAQAEAQATAEVKAAAAEMAAEMAEAVLTARLAGKKSDPLIDRAIGEIPSKLS